MSAHPDQGLAGSADTLSPARFRDTGFGSRVFRFYLGVRAILPMALPGPHFRPFRLDPAGISKTLIDTKAVRTMVRLDQAERFRSILKERPRKPSLLRSEIAPPHPHYRAWVRADGASERRRSAVSDRRGGRSENFYRR